MYCLLTLILAAVFNQAKTYDAHAVAAPYLTMLTRVSLHPEPFISNQTLRSIKTGWTELQLGLGGARRGPLMVEPGKILLRLSGDGIPDRAARDKGSSVVVKDKSRDTHQ